MNQNILDYEIKSISLDSLKLKHIFEDNNIQLSNIPHNTLPQNTLTENITEIINNSTITEYSNPHVNIDILHKNYKSDPLFKKFITLAIKLNCKIFKLEKDKYIVKTREELLQYSDKIKKILLKKYAINILKNVIDDSNHTVVSKIDDDFKKLKKFFIYIEMFNYLLNNIYTDIKTLYKLCYNTPNQYILDKNIKSTDDTNLSFENNITQNIHIDKHIQSINSERSSECISGKLECLSSTSNIDISFDSNITYNLSPYINYTPSKGKVINISLKSYIAEYSN